MKAVRFHEVGGPEVLRYEDVPVPEPGPGQVRVKVAASAFNAADAGMRAGFLPIPVVLPHVPGYDVSGTVDKVGEGVGDAGPRPGDAVIGFLPMERDGGAAEYVTAPAQAWVAAPTSLPLADAAALPSVALTAWQALFDDADLHEGQRLLINGAGGVVGKYAIALAKRAGVHVVATASPRSAEAVRAAGADEVIDHTTTDVLGAVEQQVDVVLNLAAIEPEQFTALVSVVRDGGKVVSTTAFLTTPSDETRGVSAATVFVQPNRERLAELVSLVDGGALTVEVTRRIPLADLPALHAEAAEGRVVGKVLVLAGEVVRGLPPAEKPFFPDGRSLVSSARRSRQPEPVNRSTEELVNSLVLRRLPPRWCRGAQGVRLTRVTTSRPSPGRVVAFGTVMGGVFVLPVTWAILCAVGPVRLLINGASVPVALRASSLTREDWLSLPILALMLVPAGAITGLLVSGVSVLVAQQGRVPRPAARFLSAIAAAGLMTVMLVATGGPLLTMAAAAAAAVVAAAAGSRAPRLERPSGVPGWKP